MMFCTLFFSTKIFSCGCYITNWDFLSVLDMQICLLFIDVPYDTNMQYGVVNTQISQKHTHSVGD